MDWRETLINSLQIIAAVSAAIFAGLGLFTEYKKDGKVTLYGRIAVAGIVISAFCALGTQWAQSALDAQLSRDSAKAARDQRGREDIRFGQQMQQLQRLYRQLSAVSARSTGLADQMTNSLATLRHVESETIANRRIEQQNTTRLLRTMWQDANRIGSASIELMATYQCGRRPGTQLPNLFPPGALAQLEIEGVPGLNNGLLLSVRHQSVEVQPVGWVDGSDVINVVEFDGFAGQDLPNLAAPASWAGARVRMIISAPLTAPLEAVQAALTSPMTANPRPQTLNFPCEAAMHLMINGREVAEDDTLLTVVRAGETLSVVMESPSQPIRQSAFPLFSSR